MTDLNDIARLLQSLTDEVRGLRADLERHLGKDAPVSDALVRAIAFHAVLGESSQLVKPDGRCEQATTYAQRISDFVNREGPFAIRKPSAEDIAYRAANPGHWSIATLRAFGVPEEDLTRIQAEREAAASEPRGIGAGPAPAVSLEIRTDLDRRCAERPFAALQPQSKT